MRLIRISLCLFLLCLLNVNLALGQEPRLQQAESAYLSNDYAKVTELLNSVIDQSANPSAGVYYNLANTYYTLGDYTLALLNYRRAQYLNPRNANIEQQIAIINARLGHPQSGNNNSLLSLSSRFTFNELLLFCFCVWWLFWIVAGFSLLRPAIRSHSNPILAIIALIFLIGASLTAINGYDTQFQPAAIVIQDALVKSGPDEHYPSLYTLSTANEIHITQTESDWVRFFTHDGRVGWLRSTDIERIDAVFET